MKSTALLTTWLALTSGLLLTAATPKASPTSYGQLIFEDHFDRTESQELKNEPGNDWTTSSEKTAGGHKEVDLRNGAMYMYTHKTANHAVSTRHAFAFTDGTIGMRFMLENDEDELRLNFADMDLKTVHAGHLFDAKVSLTSIEFEDKKTGGMDLKIQAARKAGPLSPETTALLKTKKLQIAHTLKKGVWHDLLVHVAGDKISMNIDGRDVGEFRSEGFAHSPKALLRLLVPHEAVVDDVMIWRKK